jgi:hypothetical protein
MAENKRKRYYHVSMSPDERSDSCNIADSVLEIHRISTHSEGKPYIQTKVLLNVIFKEYNPQYGDDKLCKCGHSYYRHFDSWEGMAPVGCKYCGCREFVPADDSDEGAGSAASLSQTPEEEVSR